MDLLLTDWSRAFRRITLRNVPIAWPAVAVAVFAGALFFDRLGDRDLWSSHEARAAQDAQRFLDEGGWGLLRLFDDQLEYQKPPLYYWLVALVAKCRGGVVDAWAVRMPAALGGLATVLAVYAFLAARGRRLAAGLSAGILASATHFTWASRTGRIDVPLTFAATCAILAFFHASDPRLGGRAVRFWQLSGYMAIAAGVMLKGPLALILPLAVLIVVKSCERLVGNPGGACPLLRSLAWGLPIVALIAGPWFVAAHVQSGGEFTRDFFWYHHVQRAAGGAEALAAHPWWFYGPRLLVDWLPCSVAFPFAAWLSRRCLWSESEGRLGLAWSVAVLALLSLSRFKRADYLLPSYPGVALWLGCAGERAYKWWFSPRERIRCSLAAGAAAILFIAGWATVHRTVVPRLDAEREKRTFAAAIRAVAPRPTLVLCFRVEDHLLAFHLGRPINTFMEWENLDVWVSRPGPHFVVMPAECAARWRRHVTSGTLEELLRYEDRTDRSRPRGLVVMRTRPQPPARADERLPRPTEDREGADHRPAPGVQPGGGP
jgi:4-amino-4-deoxy-L-arabinose transferase-like glycosyltransferase